MDQPAPVLIRSPEDAELVARDWLGYFGFVDAEVTAGGADGGVDVEGAGIVAQAKAEMKPVGRPVVQQIFGEASLRGVLAAVFSLSGYTVEAEAWAQEAEVALFEFDLQGTPAPVNVAAELVVADGASDAWRSRLRDLLDAVSSVTSASAGLISDAVSGIDPSREMEYMAEAYEASQVHAAALEDAKQKAWDYAVLLFDQDKSAELDQHETLQLLLLASDHMTARHVEVVTFQSSLDLDGVVALSGEYADRVVGGEFGGDPFD